MNEVLKKVTLDDKYTQTSGTVFLSAIQALVKLPIMQRVLDEKAGLNTAGFISGYRGSPLGGYDKALWSAQKNLDEHNIKFTPGINEDLGATAVWGSQQAELFEGALYDGVFGIWYGKGPGVDRSGDVFKHANAAGTSVHGGALAIIGDDHACRSSTLPHQSEYAMMDAMIPVLNPGNVEDLLAYGLFGFALSRYSGCWAALKTIEEIADTSVSLDLDAIQTHFETPDDFEMPEGGLSIRRPDTSLEQEKRLHNQKMPAVFAFARKNGINKVIIAPETKKIGIVATGKAYFDALEAFEKLGLSFDDLKAQGIGLYKVGMSWPLEPEGMQDFALGYKKLVVFEEKRPVIENQLKDLLYHAAASKRPEILGKTSKHPLLPTTYELNPDMLCGALIEAAGRVLPEGARQAYIKIQNQMLLSGQAADVQRLPYYCPGCPHNTSTTVPEGSEGLAGIGCHYMVRWMDRKTELFTHMGGEGVPWIGQAPFTKMEHIFANLGDGTYYHSGLLAIRAAVASGVNITYKILYNDAVAMTGGQPVDGPISVAEITHQVRAEGVDRIAVVSDDTDKYKHHAPFADNTTVHHRDEMDSVQKELREIKGTSILIYDQTCAAEKRRRRKRGLLEDPAKRIFINDLVCEGCGDCGQVSNCIAINPLETEFGRKREIDQSACNKDYTCVKGFCPSFVSVEGGVLRKNTFDDTHAPKNSLLTLPMPKMPNLDQPFNILVTGIGGTGIVTIGGILGMAAHIEGKGCSILDITGLAQKGGPVTSHIRIAKKPADIKAARIAFSETNTLIAADLVVTTSPDLLARFDKTKTRAVVDVHDTMPGQFTKDADFDLQSAHMKDIMEKHFEKKNLFWTKAHTLATKILGDSLYTNMFLLGYAFQKGMIPISHDAIRAAIDLNGVKVSENRRAFLWGRRAAADNLSVERLFINKTKKAETFDDKLRLRVQFLKDYQNKAYAEKYVQKLNAILDSEKALGSDKKALGEAVMRYLFKLMTYKDEYEVARLYTSGHFKKRLKAQFEGRYQVKLYLAPPLISRRDKETGHLKKMTFGPWIFGFFHVLSKFKFLRGTPFDIFGYTEERRHERTLIDNYVKNIDLVLEHLSSENYDHAVSLLSVPEMVRGFGHVKEAHIKKSEGLEKMHKDAFLNA